MPRRPYEAASVTSLTMTRNYPKALLRGHNIGIKSYSFVMIDIFEKSSGGIY